MNAHWSGFAILLSLVVGAAAEDDYAIKVYPAPLADRAPTIDGRFDDSVWRQAPLVGGFTWYNRPERVPVQTFFRAAYDARALYLALHADEPEMDKLSVQRQARDASAIFHDESIELFLDPRHTHRVYYQLGINAAGSAYDSRGHDSSWNSGVRVGAARVADGWQLEVAIPWSDLGITPRSGWLLGMNVCRNRYLGGKQWSNWSQTKANFHDPERFGHLVLSPGTARLAQMVDALRKGDRRGPVVVYGREGFANTTYRALAQQTIRRAAKAVDALRAAADRERDRAAARAISQRASDAEREVDKLRQQVEGVALVDAAAWMRVDMRLNALIRELSAATWEARLGALLDGI